jgi:hypothetical protein
MKLPAKEVQVTLENGQVLHFIASEGDSVIVRKIVTQPTGTTFNHPEFITYYTAQLSHKDK